MRLAPTVVWFILLLVACRKENVEPAALTVTARDIAFDPTALTLRADQPVELTLYNAGALQHDFNLSEAGSAPAPTPHGDHAGHGTSGIHALVEPGETAVIRFAAPKAGRYTYYCSVAGHAEAGMAGELTVTP